MGATGRTTSHRTWAGAVDGYTTWMRAAGRSAGTIKLHRYYLDLLARHHPRGGPWTVTAGELQELVGTPHWKPETRKSARTVFRGFYGWAEGEGLTDSNPAARLAAVRVPAGVARPTPESVLADAIARADARTGLMIRLAAFAGLRCGEIARMHSTDLVGDVLTVRGKGGKVREVPLPPDLVQRLQGVDGWVFPGRVDGHLSPGSVSRLLSRALPAGWTGHTLRHRMATRAYRGTRDLLAVGAVLGHSRPETTQRYVQMPDDAVRRAVEAAAG